MQTLTNKHNLSGFVITSFALEQALEQNNINNEKLTNSSSSNELFSDSLENIHSATGNLIKSKDSLSANQINNSNDTSSSRNRNSSISSSTSTGSEGGMQIYEVENAMITNKMVYADKDTPNCKNYNSSEFADLTETIKIT